MARIGILWPDRATPPRIPPGSAATRPGAAAPPPAGTPTRPPPAAQPPPVAPRATRGAGTALDAPRLPPLPPPRRLAMTEETETDASGFARMFDKLPAFNPPDISAVQKSTALSTYEAELYALRGRLRSTTSGGRDGVVALRRRRGARVRDARIPREARHPDLHGRISGAARVGPAAAAARRRRSGGGLYAADGGGDPVDAGTRHGEHRALRAGLPAEHGRLGPRASGVRFPPRRRGLSRLSRRAHSARARGRVAQSLLQARGGART